MKRLSFLLLLIILPAMAFCQTIVAPMVGTSEEPTTVITKIEFNKTGTCIYFKHVSTNAGNWIQLNKSIYVQDADGEARYNYVRSEGIPLRPLQHDAKSAGEELAFKVYFEPLKPGTKSINIIERALSPDERVNGATYFNYYRVSLEHSGGLSAAPTVRDVRLMATDTVASPFKSWGNPSAMLGNMYKTMLETQISFYSDPAKLGQMAKVTKNYFDALIRAGFAREEALKIITSKQLISPGIGGN